MIEKRSSEDLPFQNQMGLTAGTKGGSVESVAPGRGGGGERIGDVDGVFFRFPRRISPLNVCSCRLEKIRATGSSGQNVEGGAQVAPGFARWHLGPEESCQFLSRVFFLLGGEIDEKGPRLVEEDKGTLAAFAEKHGRAEKGELKKGVGGGVQGLLNINGKCVLG